MSDKGKQGSIPQFKKRGYVTWNTPMDEVLISVLYAQVTEGNKGDGDWKPQAHQAVVDELRIKLGMSLTTEQVKNRIKNWKKHYGMITEIRNKTKFKWDDESKMLVITLDDMTEWLKYTQVNPGATAYANKVIDHWDDISVLVGPDRATGDGGEHHEEGANRMDDEACDNVSSNIGVTSTGSRKRQKRDQLIEVVSSFADSFRCYVDSKMAPPTLTAKEIRDEVSKIDQILPYQVLKCVMTFMKRPEHFEALKDTPEEDKLRWIRLCLDTDM